MEIDKILASANADAAEASQVETNFILAQSTVSSSTTTVGTGKIGFSKDSSGPKFNSGVDKKIAQAQNNGWGKQFEKFVQEKKYTLLVAIGIITLMAVGFFIGNTLNTDTLPASFTSQIGTITNESILLAETGATNDTSTQVTSSFDGNVATEIAQTGDGITHLARRALATYLASETIGLNAEQLVYAEDFLQNLTGTQLLNVGEIITFSAQDIETSITGALELTDLQLENLKLYTI